jgi:penicillin-binding protein 1C
VPAVKTLKIVGVEPFVQRLQSLGFRALKPAEFYGPSLALGSADVNLWEMVNAYRCLARGGLRDELHLVPAAEAESPVRIFAPEAAFIVSDILSDRESRSRTFNLDSPLATRFWSAVKTGTSKDMRDNWCIGYSDRYTAGVWTGNFSGEPMWDVSGVTGAAPVWVELMNYLHRDSAGARPMPPAGVRRASQEWFIAGSEAPEAPGPARMPGAHIVYPADGTIVALDPDIPSEEQKLFFEARPASRDFRWLLNGEDIGPADTLRLWSPRRGSYTLTLVDAARRTSDTVTFQVR